MSGVGGLRDVTAVPRVCHKGIPLGSQLRGASVAIGASRVFIYSFLWLFMDREVLQGVLAALSTDLATVVLGRDSTRSRSEGTRAFEDNGREVIRDILGSFSQDSFITAVEA